MAKTLPIYLSIFLLHPPLCNAIPDLKWERVSEKKGILVSKAELPGTKLIAFRGEGVISAPLLKVAHVVRDASRGTEWIAGLKESRVLKLLSPFEFLEYDRMGMPFPVRDRDFVTRALTEIDVKTNWIRVRFASVEDPLQPPVKGLVRGDLLWASFEMWGLDSGSTRVIAEAVGDPKGHLPKWLVNWFQKGWPRATLLNLARQVAKEDVSEDPDLAKLWVKSPSP